MKFNQTNKIKINFSFNTVTVPKFILTKSSRILFITNNYYNIGINSYLLFLLTYT